MRKIAILVISALIMPLFAVHNFTVNGEETASVSVSDSIHFEFEYETAGNSAEFALSLEIIGQNIPIFSGDFMIFQDGGIFDETGVDGYFSGGFNNFAQLPENTTLALELIDDEVSDIVYLEFEQLNTNFSISGTVLQEGEWIDLPVIGALVYTIYNGGIDVIIDLFENFDLQTFLDFISSDHYILSDLTGFLGTYQIYVPEDIPDVSCLTGVYSINNMQGEYIAPSYQEFTVNGHVNGIDFMYYYPDGLFYGVIMNEEEEPVTGAAIMLQDPNSPLPQFFSSDSLGNFSIALADGIYDYMVTALGYEIHSDAVEIDGDDVYREIILSPLGGSEALFYGYVLNNNAEPVINAEIMVLPVEPSGDPLYQYSMGDGSFSFELQNGSYSYLVSHANYIGVTGEFQLNGEDYYEEIIMQPVTCADEVTATLSLSCYPNPFNPQINIAYSLAEKQDLCLEIYNIKGQKIDTLLRAELEAGTYRTVWKADNQSSGIYLLRLFTNSDIITRKLILMK